MDFTCTNAFLTNLLMTFHIPSCVLWMECFPPEPEIQSAFWSLAILLIIVFWHRVYIFRSILYASDFCAAEGHGFFYSTADDLHYQPPNISVFFASFFVSSIKFFQPASASRNDFAFIFEYVFFFLKNEDFSFHFDVQKNFEIQNTMNRWNFLFRRTCKMKNSFEKKLNYAC